LLNLRKLEKEDLRKIVAVTIGRFKSISALCNAKNAQRNNNILVLAGFILAHVRTMRRFFHFLSTAWTIQRNTFFQPITSLTLALDGSLPSPKSLPHARSIPCSAFNICERNFNPE
jgi:hypothetical protein